jgi:pimeloyl-ACP methyl ester carboxylesterase
MMRPQTYHTFASEAESAAISAEQARQVRSLRDLPVLVLTAGNSFAAFQALMPNLPVDRANRVWLKLQTDLTTLSRNSTHRVLEGAGHYLMVDAPDFVSQSITEFVFRAGMGSKNKR